MVLGCVQHLSSYVLRPLKENKQDKLCVIDGVCQVVCN